MALLFCSMFLATSKSGLSSRAAWQQQDQSNNSSASFDQQEQEERFPPPRLAVSNASARDRYSQNYLEISGVSDDFIQVRTTHHYCTRPNFWVIFPPV